MNGIARFMAMALLLLCPFQSKAVAEEILTWQDCVKEAAKNHPDLISAKEQVRQAKADKDITLSAALPQVTGDIGGKRSKAAAKKMTEAYSYSVSGEQLVFDGFKTVSDIASASATISAQRYNYAVVSSDIRLNLRKAFVALLRAQEFIALTEEIAKRSGQNLELVRLRYEGGREHKGSLLTAEADLAQAEFEVTQAKRNISLVQRQLSKELGRQSLSPAKVKGDFEITDAGRERPDFEYLADTTPLLKELVAKKEAARFDHDSAQADFFPQIYLNGSLGKAASSWPPEDREWSAGATMSLPIFEGGKRIAQVSKTKSQLRQAQADERSGRDSVIFTLEETWKDLQDAIDSVSVREKFLEAAGERAEIASAQYATGLIGFDDWIIIEDNLATARKAFLDAQANLLIAEAEWIQAKGGGLEYEE